ncbi:MAG: preprotein translocase subunit SecE [Spirochaetales bacterium]|jgi:preprotein translocase subunit SecE|nr:preprotein translocase subunit SecE [Spirochaetales bacterium]MBR6200651.1 preprotein translocase subunit SecE [Spirochaetales bacterium]
MKKIIKFIQESIAELKKVVWPSKDDVVAQTIVVVIGIVITAGLLAVVDFVSLQVVSKVLTLGM